MDISALIQIISTLGFPIAMCCALFWYMIRQREEHKSEMDHLRDALENNTKVLTELTTLIKKLDNEKER